MGEAGLEACVGFLAGRADACPLVGGAGSWPSGRQGCVIMKSLGNLSANEWGCVPTWLVVWPEAPDTEAYRLLGGGRSLC